MLWNHAVGRWLIAVETVSSRSQNSSKTSEGKAQKLTGIIKESYGNKENFLVDLSQLVGKPKDEEDIALERDDLVNFLLGKPSKRKTKIIKDCVQHCYKQLFPVSPKQTIHLAENFKGYRLLTELRRILPGILPSEHEERATRKEYEKSYAACLQPVRISTGWQIQPARLLDALKFRYPYLQGKILVRLTGDGREYGGRHSTFVALTILNNELLLHNVSHQSPKECFPVALFYESDSRDNLEQNLTKPTNVLSDFICSQKDTQYEFFFAADEMFAQACTDGSGNLNPKSATNWNLYGTNDVEQKKVVADSGLRTDLDPLFDRSHPESLFPGISIEKFVFCVLHGGARCVEKLLNLEVENIMSEKNKLAQTKSEVDGQDLVHNLEANINRRGVKNRNFRIHFNEKSGKPEPVSLNKDSALAVISPSPPGLEAEFPHPLHNVIPKRQVVLSLPKAVHEYLKLPAQVNEFELVSMIWISFHFMFTTLKSEPSNQTETQANNAVSPDNEDHRWGYSDEQKLLYKFHAERFYQLFQVRYSHRHLTPYMMKFIDYAPYFMENLPVPLNRFQTEGSEHMNYEHNCFYYSHTTRHGGKNKVEPLKALFMSTWRKLCYQIEFQSDNKDSAEAFQQFCARYKAAVTISRHVRGWLVRRKLKRRGLIADPENQAQRLHNLTVVRDSMQDECIPENTSAPSSTAVFSGMTFVLCGTVPKQKDPKDGKQKKFSQSSVENFIKCNGGRVRNSLPGVLKGRSTKNYVVLFDKGAAKKIPSIVKSALSRNYYVLQYKFIFDSLSHAKSQDMNHYSVDLSSLKSRLTKQISLHKMHFSKTKTMISLVKRSSKQRRAKKKSVSISTPVNIAVYYALDQRKKALQTNKFSFRECQLGKYMSEWKSLPADHSVRGRTVTDYSNYRTKMRQAILNRQKESRTACYFSVV